MNLEEFKYKLCVKSLRNPINLSDSQKKEYTSFLLTDYAHKVNENALKEGKYNDIYLKASYKFAKHIKKEEKSKSNIIFKWIIENKETFVKKKVCDIYLIGAAEAQLDPNFTISKKDFDDNCCTDFQKFQYLKENDDKKCKAFIKKISDDVHKSKEIKNISFLHELFFYSLGNKLYENTFLFFRLYCARVITKKADVDIEVLKSFIKILKDLRDNKISINDDLQKEVCDFLIFNDSVLYNSITPSNSIMQNFYNTVTEVINKIIFLPENRTYKDINIYIKFLFGRSKFQDNKFPQSEIYFRAASNQNYFKAMYFLSEVIKKSDPKKALDLYDKIIKFDNNVKDSEDLNNQSDRLERAFAFYQKGLVYAEGLYSIAIDWEIVDQSWGDPESDLCITKLEDAMRFKYISSECLNFQFIKYKADHGLLEAKHMYYKICREKNLTNENDILLVYMHELCLYSNFDPKYIDEMEEYARCLEVGEGVEKDKKKAKMIQDKIKENKKIKKNK